LTKNATSLSPGPSPFSSARQGRVEAFDEKRGLGILRDLSDEDGASYSFHCTAITDGTRSIDAGTLVCFTLFGGNGGRVEARDLVVLWKDA